MGRRTSKLTETRIVSVFAELPGAVFYGDILPNDLAVAKRMQAIRHDYEETDDQTTLWYELTAMGFGTAEIGAFILNPAALTDCGYCGFESPTPGVSLTAGR